MVKKIVSKMVDTISCYSLEGSAVYVADMFAKLTEKHGPSTRISWNPNHWEPYDREASPRFEVYVDLTESEQEEAARLAKERAEKADREARERAEFERLKRKFG